MSDAAPVPSHLSQMFAKELVVAATSTDLDVRFLHPDMDMAMPDSPNWLAIATDNYEDSRGPAEFDKDTISGLVRAAQRAVIVACPPLPPVVQAVLQTALAGGGCIAVLTATPRVFDWLTVIREAGDYAPPVTVLRRPTRP